jgi:hypothetical protein
MKRSPKFYDSINDLKITETEYIRAGIGKKEKKQETS